MNLFRIFAVLSLITARVSTLTAATSSTAAIRTPPAAATPRINGPSIFGVRPDSPFLYRIPATGDRPMEFSAKGLPTGLQLDPKTGELTGVLTKPGQTVLTLHAKNSKGTSEKKFRIVVGD